MVEKSKQEDYRCRCVEYVESRDLFPHSVLYFRPIKQKVHGLAQAPEAPAVAQK